MSGNSKVYKPAGLRSFSANFYARSKGFLNSWAIVATASFLYILLVNKGSEVIAINAWSKPGFDPAVLFVTRLGEGAFVVLVAAVLLLFKVRWALYALVTLAFTGILSGVFKHLVFPGYTRPLHYFYYDDFPRFLYDVPIIYFNSFPSGHTMSAFALCAVIAYISGRFTVGAILFPVAFMVGISRIYLLQHFGADVLLGSLLGIIAAFFSVAVVEMILKSRVKPWSEKGLRNFLFK